MTASSLSPIIIRRLNVTLSSYNEVFRSVQDAITQHVEPEMDSSVVHISNQQLKNKEKSEGAANKERRRKGT
jgi:hypothetical protein